MRCQKQPINVSFVSFILYMWSLFWLFLLWACNQRNSLGTVSISASVNTLNLSWSVRNECYYITKNLNEQLIAYKLTFLENTWKHVIHFQNYNGSSEDFQGLQVWMCIFVADGTSTGLNRWHVGHQQKPMRGGGAIASLLIRESTDYQTRYIMHNNKYTTHHHTHEASYSYPHLLEAYISWRIWGIFLALKYKLHQWYDIKHINLPMIPIFFRI